MVLPCGRSYLKQPLATRRRIGPKSLRLRDFPDTSGASREGCVMSVARPLPRITHFRGESAPATHRTGCQDPLQTTSSATFRHNKGPYLTLSLKSKKV